MTDHRQLLGRRMYETYCRNMGLPADWETLPGKEVSAWIRAAADAATVKCPDCGATLRVLPPEVLLIEPHHGGTP